MTSKPARKHHRPSTPRGAHALTGFLLLLLAIVLAYGNTRDASWHLDDYHNITYVRALHLQELTPSALWETLFRTTDRGQVLYRPVARLTFALNWYFGQSRVFGYHVVNILLHWATTCLVFMTCRQLLALPRAKFFPGDGYAYGAAMGVALLWGLNPIQTQAVTYIVQRMAVMVALFSLAALWLYIRGRQRQGIAAAWHFSGVMVCFLLAMGSKENAVVLPLTLLLAEICFFQDLDSPHRRRWLWLAAGITVAIAAVVGTAAYFILHQGNYNGFLETYRERSFTLGQRLLTEPRVVLTYIGQIFFPAPWRLSIEHDVVVSTSLWQPWTTLPAILGIALLGLTGLSQMRSRPLFAFAVLFFLINHSVESTILPLELFFEHRNYLPSMFIFLPLAAGMATWMKRRCVRHVSKAAVYALSGMLVIVAACWTYQRNMVWQSERSLWEDVLTKVPNSARAHHNLAWAHYHTNRQYDQAMVHYRKALKLYGSHSGRQAAVTQYNLGLLLIEKGDLTQAESHLAAAAAARPSDVKTAYWHAVVLSANGRLDEADRILERLNGGGRRLDTRGLNIKALTALRRMRHAAALEMLKSSLRINPDNWRTNYYLGATLTAVGEVQQAAHFLEKAHRLQPGEPLIWLHRIQNYHQAQEIRAEVGAIDEFCGTETYESLRARVMDLSRNPFAAPLDTENVLALIRSRKTGATQDVPGT